MTTADQFAIGAGVRQAMDDAGDEARGNEVYISASFSLTPGRDFAYLYSLEANEIYKLPKA
jgi:hypothetical protein